MSDRAKKIRETHSQLFFSIDIISCNRATNFNNVQKLLLHIGFEYEDILPKSFQVSSIRTVSSQSATGRLCAAVSIYHLLVSHLPEKFSAKRAKSNQVQVIIQKHTWYFDKRSFGLLILFICRSLSTHQPFNYISLYRTHSLVSYVYLLFFCVRNCYIRECLTGVLGDRNVSGRIFLNRHRHVVFNVCRSPMPAT